MLIYRKSEIAQGLVEYGLVLILVSVAVILALNVLAPTIGNTFSEVGDTLESL
jgi:Flp pilus assembly pilin Flp